MDPETNRILVVDDNAITARWVALLTEQMGFNAVLAGDGEAALSRLAGEQFIGVISDVDMPGMDGIELLRNIRLLYPAMPVILMTVNDDVRFHEAARTYGAWALLEKPVNAHQLAALVGTGTRPPGSIEGLHVFATPQVAT